jgi:hypothetical protein
VQLTGWQDISVRLIPSNPSVAIAVTPAGRTSLIVTVLPSVTPPLFVATILYSFSLPEVKFVGSDIEMIVHRGAFDACAGHEHKSKSIVPARTAAA